MYRHVAMETFVRVVDTGPFSAAASQMSASQQFPKPLRSAAAFTGKACSAHPRIRPGRETRRFFDAHLTSQLKPSRSNDQLGR